LLDAAQSAGVVPIDLKATPIDLLAFPGHKGLFGPTGTGALYVRPGLAIQNWREGARAATRSRRSSPRRCLRARRRNPERARHRRAGGRRAVGERPGDRGNRRHEVALLQRVVDWVELRAERRLEDRRRWEPETHVGALSLITPNLDELHPRPRRYPRHQLQHRRPPGLHCAPYIHRNLGSFPDGTLRLSPGPFNTPEQVDVFSKPSRRSPRESSDAGPTRFPSGHLSATLNRPIQRTRTRSSRPIRSVDGSVGRR